MKTLIIGAAIIDIIMNIEKIPKKGEDVLCNKTTTSIGGCAYNVANILRKFNVEHDLFVPIGKGIYADIIKKDLMKNNYKILINDSQMDNGYSLCLVEEDGERSFITMQGIEGQYKKKWFNKIDMSKYESIYIAGYQLVGYNGEILVDWLIKQKDKTVFFAPGPFINKIEKHIINKIISMKPLIHLNEKEALSFTKKIKIKESILDLYNLSKNSVFITMGENGTLFYDGNELIEVKGEKVRVIDTIGAGDSHIGTIISLYSKGYDFGNSIKLANKVAEKVVQIQGSTLDDKAFKEIEFLI